MRTLCGSTEMIYFRALNGVLQTSDFGSIRTLRGWRQLMICKFPSERKHTLARTSQLRFFDRRKRMRFPLVARVEYSWADATGSTWHGRGQTVNISERGALIGSPVVPPEGTTVEIRFFLPPISTDHPKSVEFLMKATVVRVENKGAASAGRENGFAVKAHFAEMTWPSEPADC